LILFDFCGQDGVVWAAKSGFAFAKFTGGATCSVVEIVVFYTQIYAFVYRQINAEYGGAKIYKFTR